MKELYIFVLFLCHVICVNGVPVNGDTKSSDTSDRAKNYFVRYGYLESFSDAESPKVMAASIKRFQFFANLVVTGALNSETINQMDVNRCGMVDPELSRVINATNKKRYVLQGYQWDMTNNEKRELTWRVVGGGRRITREQTRRVMYQALGIWEKHSNLHFREVSASSKVDIIVKYGRLCHGDRYCFDYKGGTLAHAFYPYPGQEISGDVHFDDDEDYSIGGKPGTDLLWVAVHELGHSLGLEHTNIKGAIMYPWYQGHKADFDLTDDDIRGIQALYGPAVAQPKTQPPQPRTQLLQPRVRTQPPTKKPPPTEPPTTQPRKTRPPPKKGCPNAVNAMMTLPKYRAWIFIFDGDNMYLASKDGVRHGPIKAKNYFAKITDNIDAAVTRPKDGVTIIFSGNNYYEYNGFNYKKGPLPLQDLGLTSDIQKIDGALLWKRNSKGYLFTDKHYWRFNFDNNRVDKEYPRLINGAWKGIPNSISSVVTGFEGLTYFVKGDKHFLLDSRSVSVVPGFPKYFGDEWLYCRRTSAIREKASRLLGAKVPLAPEP